MSPNKNFRLDLDDIELIENSLRNEMKNLADQKLTNSENKMRKIHDLLGKIHNQKIWYRPKNYIGG